MVSRLRSKRLLRTVSVLAMTAIAPLAAPRAAEASVIASVVYSPYGLPSQSGAVSGINLNSAPLGATPAAGITFNSGANAVTLTTSQNGAIVNGSVTGAYAAPVTGGTTANPTYLTSNYVSSGGAPGYVALSFASEQSYLGLLWGSVGEGDLLSFYDTNSATPTVALAQVTGTEAMTAPGFNDANGAQGFNGSEYALIDLTGGTYNKVVLSQGGYPSFEAGLFQYAAVNQAAPVPEPVSLALLGAGLAALGFVRTRRTAR